MNNSYARFCNTLYFIVGLIFCWIGIALNTDMSKIERVLLTIFLLLLFVLPIFLHSNNLIDFYKYKRTYLIIFVLIAVFSDVLFGLVGDNGYICMGYFTGLTSELMNFFL